MAVPVVKGARMASEDWQSNDQVFVVFSFENSNQTISVTLFAFCCPVSTVLATDQSPTDVLYAVYRLDSCTTHVPSRFTPKPSRKTAKRFRAAYNCWT